ncbi:MAG: elongation factor G [Saprospiraceae bacterium]
MEWRDNKINIIDTPGLDDFVGEVIASLKVADTALILLNAANGVEVGSELVWEYVDNYLTPAVFVINQIDHPKADFDLTLEQAKERFGSKVIPVQYPLNTGAAFNAIIDALRMVMYVFPEQGGKPEKHPIPDSEMARAKEMHNALVEVAAENEDGLMEKYFDMGTLEEEDLAKGLTIALANHQFSLVLRLWTKRYGQWPHHGLPQRYSPLPGRSPGKKLADGSRLVCNPDDKTTLFIYKTLSEPQVGLVSYFKVYAGTLHAGDELVNAANGETERISQLFVAEGKNRMPAQKLYAGDLGVTVKLKSGHSNNTLNDKAVSRAIEPIHFPESRIHRAISSDSITDLEKIIKALHHIEVEDPTLHVEQSAALRQTIVHGQGQLHLDLIRHRVEKEQGVSMQYENPRISYRETITGGANAEYRHKKQSGGAGQFAEIHMRVEHFEEGMPDPEGLTVRQREVEELPWGGQLAFYWCIVGGSIDSRYTNAIKKGIRQKMEHGPLTGSPCQNIRVSVYDGKMHSVDSNDISFQLAAGSAFKEAFHESSPQLLEPVYKLEVLCPENEVGDIMSDLQTRRAIIQGMDSDGHYQKIIAEVPLAEMHDYSTALRSIAKGRAKFTMRFVDYHLVPYNIQQELVKNHEVIAEA